MSDRRQQHAPSSSILGQLQRGRGCGYVAAVAAGQNAHEDLFHCLLSDPRNDGQLESREGYYAELLVALDLPLAPLVAHLRDRDVELGHAVLAGTWRLGHQATRALLSSPHSNAALVTGIAEQLWDLQWASLVDLPPRAAKVFLKQALQVADSTESQRRNRTGSQLPGAMSVQDLLELGRTMQHGQRWAVVEELCRRGTEADRVLLAETVTNDLVFDRVRLAARALGTLGDERLLSTAMDYFGRDDVFEDPTRRLSGYDRMRRSALNDYVQHLPIDRQLELARAWHGRGGYFAHVAGSVFGEQATPDDRSQIESFVADHGAIDDSWDVIEELDALGRIGDPRSAPLLVHVAQEATYSEARRRALRALAGMQQLPIAVVALREALWDCEDAAAETSCARLQTFDQDARERLTALAGHALADDSLRAQAQKRLRDDSAKPGQS